MIIGNVGTTAYNTWTGRTNGAKAQESNNFRDVAAGKVMTCTAQGSNKVMLRSDACKSEDQTLGSWDSFLSMSKWLQNITDYTAKSTAISVGRKEVDNAFCKITKGENNTIEVYDKTTGISYRFEEAYLSVQTDAKTGAQFLISDIPYTTMNVEAMKLTPQLKVSMEQYLNGEEVAEKILDTKFTLYRDRVTGIESLNWRSGDGFSCCMMISTKEQMQKYEELANIYLSNYPNLVSGHKQAQMRAEWEIMGWAKRTPTGIISITSNAISYEDNNDYGTNPPDFSHCWTYFYDEKMHQEGYEDFIHALQEYMLSANWESLKNMDDFIKGFLEKSCSRGKISSSEQIRGEERYDTF